MTMWLVFAFAAFATVILYALARAAWTYRRWRGTRLVICPETRDYAAVTVDAEGAARRAITGKPDIHLAGCHRWPERGRCDEPCLNQLTDSFDGPCPGKLSLVFRILIAKDAFFGRLSGKPAVSTKMNRCLL